MKPSVLKFSGGSFHSPDAYRKITDEFSAFPVSPQRQSQLRNKRDGKCVAHARTF